MKNHQEFANLICERPLIEFYCIIQKQVTAESILVNEEFEFPSRTVFANNSKDNNLRVRF